ncbi:MAG: iron-containing redox enzyme family protein [Cyanobacteria bacterium J06626_14]
MIATVNSLQSASGSQSTAEDVIVENCNKHPIVQHSFFTRLRAEKPSPQTYWTYFANFEPLTVRVPDWFASLLLRVENYQLKGLLASIIYDELGRGDLTKIHCDLMRRLVRGLEQWRVNSASVDALAPGRKLAEEFDRLYLGHLEEELFVLGSIVAGEVYGGQMAFFMADEARRQNQVEHSVFEWVFIHEEVEPQHADVSEVMAQILPTSGPGFDAVMAGAKWKQGKFWQWLDEIYTIAYGMTPTLASA